LETVLAQASLKKPVFREDFGQFATVWKEGFIMSSRFTRWLGLTLVAALWLLCSAPHARTQTTVDAAPATYVQYDNLTKIFGVFAPAGNYNPLPPSISRVTTADGQQINSAVFVPVPGKPGQTMPVGVAPAGVANNTMGGYLGAWPGPNVDVLMQQCFAGGFAWNMQGSVATTAGKGYTFTSAAAWNEYAYDLPNPQTNPPAKAAQLTSLSDYTSSWVASFPRPLGFYDHYAQATQSAAAVTNIFGNVTFAAVPQDPFTNGGAGYSRGRQFESPVYASADNLGAGGGPDETAANNSRQIQGNANQFAVLVAFSPDADKMAADIERVYAQLINRGVPALNIAVLYGNMPLGLLPAFPGLGLPQGINVVNDGPATLANFQNLVAGNAATWKAFQSTNVPDANSNLFVYVTGHGTSFEPDGTRLAPVNPGLARSGSSAVEFSVEDALNPDMFPMTTLQISTTTPISDLQLASDQVSIDGIPVGTLAPANPTAITDMSEYVGSTYTYDLQFPSVDYAASTDGAPVLVDIAGLLSGLDSLQNNAVVAITLDDGDGTVITTVEPVPEPSTITLFTTGLVGFLVYGRRREKRLVFNHALSCVPISRKERKPRSLGLRILPAVVLGLLIGGSAPLFADFFHPQPVDLDALRLPKEVEELNKALASFQKADYEQCLKFLEAAGKKHPDLLPPRLILAKLFLVNNQLPQGRAALEQAAIESPSHPELYLVFGRLALQEGRLTDAQLHFDKAIELAKEGKWNEQLRQTFQGDAQDGLAGVAEHRHDWTAAAAVLSARLKLTPKNGVARQRLGMALFHQGKRDQAADELLHASRDDRKLEPAPLILVRLYTEMGNRDHAAKWLAYGIEQNPKDPRVHLGQARWLLEQNRATEAQRAVEVAAKLDAQSREVQWLNGLIAWHLKDYAAAEQTFQALFQDTPGDFAVSNQLALALVEQANDSKRRKALQLAEINARLYPRSGEALSTLGLVYSRLDRLDEAEKALRAALSGGSGSSDTVYYLACLLTERGQSEEAKRLLKLSLGASGHFAFRKEAREKLARLDKKP
jgi:tetratricopeptide (TPR) repeat protein